MTDSDSIIAASAERLFADLCQPELYRAVEAGEFPTEAWSALVAAGLDKAATSAARGGVSASKREIAALVQAVGARSLPLPLVETLLAEQLLGAAGLPPSDEALTVAPVFGPDQALLRRSGGGWTVTASLHQVPWGRHLGLVCVAASDAGPVTLRMPRPSRVVPGLNAASEPRDDLIYRDVPVDPAAIGTAGAGLTRHDLFALGALYRAIAMVGALNTALELTVAHAQIREQFGRPIAKFQAVQHLVAQMACAVAAAGAAADAAVDASISGPAPFETALAKARIGEAATQVARIAHQVHASMGFTREYPLHLSTRRLWSWREEFGSETEWMRWIGRNVIEIGGAGLWPFLTGASRPPAVPLSAL